MKKRIVSVTATVLLAVSFGAAAGEATGYYTTHDGKSVESTLPDGRKIVVSHYYQLAKSDKADDPINNTESNCVGKVVLSKDGEVLSGSGSCFSQDPSGDGSLWWWKVDEAGTAKCPDLCGSFGYVEGYGKLKGTKGGGTWVRTNVFAEGSMGTFKSSYTR